MRQHLIYTKLIWVLSISFILNTEVLTQYLDDNTYNTLGHANHFNKIQVPEIDPRQFIVIYEWNEANENKVPQFDKIKEKIDCIEK